MLNTQRSLFQEAGDDRTYYVRMLRVCYTTSKTQQTTQPLLLSSKTFIPAPLAAPARRHDSIGIYESIGDTMQRAEAWLNATGIGDCIARVNRRKV